MTRAQKILIAVAGGLGAVALSPLLPALPIAALGGLSIKVLVGLVATGLGGAAYRSDTIHGPKAP